MPRPLALVVGLLALVLAACGGPPRTLTLHYMKLDVPDVQAAQERQTISKLHGVHNVVLEHGRDNTARIQVYAHYGHEAEVMPKVEAMGYSRVR